MQDSQYLKDLIQQVIAGQQFNFLHFWGHTPKKQGIIDKSCFSQWYPTAFKIDGVEYATAEHYMMAQKAKLFADEEHFAKIIASIHPNEAKKFGRLVKNYDAAIWEQHRFEIVVEGNIAKFSQHEDLKNYLLGTGERVLVEASPVDQIWGTGLAEGHANANRPEKWQGLNLLGFALMQVRQRLQQQMRAELS